ncbi:molecular chaperone [Porphyrobacter algicida]|uniref:Molecular chaperone n=1 Tax=Qipengyuania algicida TaxID=1836209 RepID=A0A845AF55_9SPHN|nr:ATP12 family protein [Qipengyuania algicida]MXP27591.1 molecular chaperone [Qipengyuania algicida]
MKRFYKDATVQPVEGEWQVHLDGRGVKTQGGKRQIVPNTALAELLRAEWAAQGEDLVPASFIYRDIADYALDVVEPDRDAAITTLLRYAETDTLCYRADPEDALWHRQCAVWDPLLEAIETREGVRFQRVSGVMHKPQGADVLDRLRARLEQLDAFTLAALNTLTSLAASLTIGLSALEPDADSQTLWDAANLEEDWQAEQWGSDAEAEDRCEFRRHSFAAALAFARAAQG